MYIDFYGLLREPFRTTPDADSLFLSPSHREALSSILYGIKERKGIIVVTGEVGTGKTTIIRRYLKIAVPLPQKTIHLYNPNITFERLLITILNQLGVDQVSGEAAEMVRQLHELAGGEYRRDSTVVVVIDEAQCMPVETLEGIRMLSNLETSDQKLIQIVLMGQPELQTLLDRHELRHVRERVAVRAKILPLTRKESLAYIDHRLMQVSREQRSIFSTAALALIIKAAEGIPRRLNILCDNALIAGFRIREQTVSGKTARHVIADLAAPPASVFWRRRDAMALAAGLLLVAPIVFYFGFGLGLPWEPAVVTSSDAQQFPQVPVLEPPAPRTESPVELAGPVGAAPIAPQHQAEAPEPITQATAAVDVMSADKADARETARLLAVLLDCGRVVVGRAQSAINNPRLEDKGFSASVFEARLKKEFLARTGHDLSNLVSSPLPDRAKPLLLKLSLLMKKEVQQVQPDINKKGIGFKGFIPATFATRVAQHFSDDTGLKVRQIGPPGIAPRNPDNKPSDDEEQTLMAIQKNHPRAGDHIMEQPLPDGIQVLLPLFYNKQCLACHGKPKGEIDISGYEKEGFKEGDLGGAISVILPIAETRLDERRPGKS